MPLQMESQKETGKVILHIMWKNKWPIIKTLQRKKKKLGKCALYHPKTHFRPSEMKGALTIHMFSSSVTCFTPPVLPHWPLLLSMKCLLQAVWPSPYLLNLGYCLSSLCSFCFSCFYSQILPFYQPLIYPPQILPLKIFFAVVLIQFLQISFF